MASDDVKQLQLLRRVYKVRGLILQKVIGNLSGIKDRRNMFAHWPLDMAPAAIENFDKNKIITFVKFSPVKFKVGQDPTEVENHHWNEAAIRNTLSVIKSAIVTLRLLEGQTPPSRK